MTDLLAQKRVDAQAIASELDVKILQITSIMREKYEIAPRLVEIAHGHAEFEIPEDYVRDHVEHAKAIGIKYEIENVGTSDSRLSDRIAILSNDRSVHGMRVSGWRLHRGEETYDFRGLAPVKDIDCESPQRFFEILQGSMYTVPMVGAIRRLIRSVFIEKTRQEVTLAVIGQAYDRVTKCLIANDYFGTVLKCEEIRSENVELIRAVDAIITSGDLDSQWLRQGQLIVNRNVMAVLPKATASLVQMAPLMRAFAGWQEISKLARRESLINLLLGIIWQQGGLPPKSSGELARLLL